MKVTVQDLRKNMKGIWAAIDRNEEVILTYRGRPKAVIVPYPNSTAAISASEHSAFGMWAERKDINNVETFVRDLRTGRF